MWSRYNKIIDCQERKAFLRYAQPTSLRDLGVKRIINRQIIEWSGCLGSYGQGGPGFFGLRLKEEPSFSSEWLVLTLWGAYEWLLLDDCWLYAHPNQHHIQQPLWGNNQDKVTEKLVGAKIIDISVERDETLIRIQNKSNRHLLELPSDCNRLPKSGGSLEPKKWTAWEHHLDAWVVSRRGKLYC